MKLLLTLLITLSSQFTYSQNLSNEKNDNTSIYNLNFIENKKIEKNDCITDEQCSETKQSNFFNKKTPTIIGVHLITYHDQPNFNGINPGFYFEKNGYTIGSYFNSINKDSIYFGYTFNVFNNFDLTAGLITGYSRNQSDLSPLLVPSLHFKIYENLRLRVHFIPRIKTYIETNAIHFSIEKVF